MQVLALVVLAVASATGKGSGPYLPSGWRPDGPAFFLPSEVKSSENPLVDVILAGSEASGSDSFREYGPPKVQEVSQNLINQGLPDVAIDQTFESVAPFVEIKEIVAEENTEAKTETPTEQSLTTTESVIIEEITVNLPVVETERIVESSQTTVANGDESTSSDVDVTQFENVYTSEGSIENIGITQQTEISSQQSQDVDSSSNIEITKGVVVSTEQEKAADVTEVSTPTEAIAVENIIKEVINLQQLQNIPDIIASLETEAKPQKTEVNQAVSNLPAIQTSGSLADGPEGFLEYGPPGFTEYGPPSINANEDKSANLLSFETNETRRRRFSPKFRLSKKH